MKPSPIGGGSFFLVILVILVHLVILVILDLLDLKVEAAALNGVGANLAVSYCYVLRVNGVAL